MITTQPLVENNHVIIKQVSSGKMKYVTKGKEMVKQKSIHKRLCVFRSIGHFKFFKMYNFKDTQFIPH